ncbi:hypothetical protein U9M48_040557 [Paspalum notatum var. saurae]|uniref:Uncharacterized protein n=1 Tax=Paspalum notatum var. saurae TaxID=547442 RepID=A0AAQ3XFP9_PASNO
MPRRRLPRPSPAPVRPSPSPGAPLPVVPLPGAAPLTARPLPSMFQQQGLTFVMPEIRPPPVPPQRGMFAQMPFSPGSGVQASNPYQTPPPEFGQHLSEQSGQHNDFVNNLFAFAGSGHNSNEPSDIVDLELETRMDMVGMHL